MTTENAARRRNRAFALTLLAAALAGIAFISLAIENRAQRPDLAAGPVVPGLAQNIANAHRITVVSSEATYHIERVQRGTQRVWVMRDRGDYPVQRGPLDQLTRGLENIQYVRRMTSDPAKHERLGVGDPRHGGRGVLVQIEGERGGYLVNLILGVQTNGLYVRRPDQDQTWAARGELPPLHDVAAWLDLSPLTLEPQTLARAEITPASGPAYVLQRPSAEEQDFVIVAPARLAAAAPSSITDTAEQIAHLTPIDVQPAPAIQGQAIAHLRVVTFDGVAIEGELINSDNKTWLKFVARAATPDREPAALAINNRAAGWAYALSSAEVAALVPPLSVLVPARQTAPPD